MSLKFERSYAHNLSSGEIKAQKNSGLRDTGAVLHNWTVKPTDADHFVSS